MLVCRAYVYCLCSKSSTLFSIFIPSILAYCPTFTSFPEFLPSLGASAPELGHEFARELQTYKARFHWLDEARIRPESETKA